MEMGLNEGTDQGSAMVFLSLPEPHHIIRSFPQGDDASDNCPYAGGKRTRNDRPHPAHRNLRDVEMPHLKSPVRHLAFH